MRMQPRQQLLEIWQAAARSTYKGGWIWGGRDGSNSISDAEQLLCILLPATEVARFRLSDPDQTEDDVAVALRPLGDALSIPRRLVSALIEYLEKYADEHGEPRFGGGSYFSCYDEGSEPTEAQLGLDVVEGYSSSIILMLSALNFARELRQALVRSDLRGDLDKLEALANRRLSAAMVGLLRSFAVNVFEIDSSYGTALLRTVNQSGQSSRKVADTLHAALRDTAAGLRDLVAGFTHVEDMDSRERLFECGWSWGVRKDAPPVDFAVDAGVQRDGYALDEPYLYFTVVALEGIAELYSERTRRQGLLNENQHRLARALELRYTLTQSYWATIASFGAAAGGRWPLEDIPWRTVDSVESDLFSLLVTSIAAREMAVRRGSDTDLSRLGLVLIELANRGRLTRRPVAADPAVGLHEPGIAIRLEGSEVFGPQLRWMVADFAPLLLKRTVRVADLINDIPLRGQLLGLADEVWEHVSRRRIQAGDAVSLWDEPAAVFDVGDRRYVEPSWHHTIRVVESLVSAANMAESYPIRSEPLGDFAQELLAEAEHLFDQELLRGSAEGGRSLRDRLNTVGNKLRRSREIVANRPGSAVSLLLTVLQDLDNLIAARPETMGES